MSQRRFEQFTDREVATLYLAVNASSEGGAETSAEEEIAGRLLNEIDEEVFEFRKIDPYDLLDEEEPEEDEDDE